MTKKSHISQLFLIIALALFTLTGCKNAPKNNSGDESTENISKPADENIGEPADMEQQAIDMVLALPEVRAIEKVSAFSNGMNEDNTYYWIQVGNDMETHFATWYHFYVYVKPKMEIKYYDVAEDRELSLDEWRKEMNE